MATQNSPFIRDKKREDYQRLKECIAQNLVKEGWKLVDDVCMRATGAVAAKDYNTVVGVRTAFAYLTTYSGKGYVLRGEYWSEGRNALSTTLFEIPKSAWKADAKAIAKLFASVADLVIANTYAVRLLNSVASE